LGVRGVEITTTEEEVAAAVAKEGGYDPQEIKTGKIRITSNRAGSLWVQCPLAAAKKAVKKGKLAVGWTQVRIELLDVRPLQCYRCLEKGHVQQHCTSSTNRSKNCYRCGGEGHKDRECDARAKCQVCAAAGVLAGHRMGGPACRLPKQKKKEEQKAA
ncbi:hypothetical protein EAI_15784, partial [Harpegnathos saltator]